MQINNITNSNFVKNDVKVTKRASYMQQKNVNQKDVFQKSLAFKGIKLPSGEYDINAVRYAKKVVAQGGDGWKNRLYEKIYKREKDSHGPILSKGMAKAGKTLDRVNVDIITLGLGEVFFYLRNLSDKQVAKDEVLKMTKIVNDVKHRKLKEDAAVIKKTEQVTMRMLEYKKDVNTAKDMKIKPELLDLLQRKREGRPTAMPNNVMFYSKEDVINNDLINWTKENANANVKTVDLKEDDLLEVLEKAEKDYKETGDWNLIHAKNMEDLINPEKSDNTTIETMKDIMGAVAEDYHSTIIFSTKNPEKLDYIALQPHRVKTLDLSNIKSPKTMCLEDAKERVHNPENIRENPLGVINDILFIANGHTNKELEWEFSLSDNVYRDVRNNVLEKFVKEDNPEGLEYMSIFNKAYHNLI